MSADPNELIDIAYSIDAFESDSDGNSDWKSCVRYSYDDCWQTGSGVLKIDLAKQGTQYKTLNANGSPLQHRAKVSWTVTPK